MNTIYDRVAAELVKLGLTDATTEHTGGGIICVLVPHDRETTWFIGTANETWGGDLCSNEDGDSVGRHFSTTVPCADEEGDPAEIARAIYAEVTK